MSTPFADLADGLELCARAVRAMAKHEPEPTASTDGVSPLAAAKQLGISRRTVYLLVKQGELKALHIGKAVRIPQSELEAFRLRRLR